MKMTQPRRTLEWSEGGHGMVRSRIMVIDRCRFARERLEVRAEKVEEF